MSECVRDSSLDVRDSSEDVRDSSEDVRDSSEDVRDSSQDMRDSSQDMRDSSEDVRDSSQDVRDSSEDMRDSSEDMHSRAMSLAFTLYSARSCSNVAEMFSPECVWAGNACRATNALIITNVVMTLPCWNFPRRSFPVRFSSHVILIPK